MATLDLRYYDEDTGQWVAPLANGVDLDDLGITLTQHENNKNNPHAVTKVQVGLGNVDNTSDVDKPISKATLQALSGKADIVSLENTNNNLTLLDEEITKHLDESRVYASAKLTYNQSIANNVDTAIMLDIEQSADFIEKDNVSQMLKITQSGIYEIILNAHFIQNSTGYRYIKPHFTVFSVQVESNKTGTTRMQAFALGRITENTSLVLNVMQNSGGALDLLNATNVVIRKVADL